MSVAEFIYTTVLKPPLLKSMANKLILTLLPESVTVENAKIVINNQDPVVSGALTFGVYEKSEIALMKRVFKPGQVMLDIGANVGLYTGIGGNIIGSQGRIFAFEPDPQSLGFLKKTVAANALENTEVVNAAASNVNGKTTLYVSTNNRGDNRLYDNELSDESFEVDTLRLDDFLEPKGIQAVDVIKIDVQGFEGQVIEGMENTLKNSSNLQMLMEFWPQGLATAGTDPVELLNRLESYGLSINELKDNGEFTAIENKAEFVSRFQGRSYTNLVVLGSNADIKPTGQGD